MYKVKSVYELVSTLQNGGPAIYDEIHFSISGNLLDITAWSSFMYMENITKQTSENELGELKFYIQDLTEDDSKLNQLFSTKQISYTLCFDSGKAGIIICREVQNKIEWFI